MRHIILFCLLVSSLLTNCGTINGIPIDMYEAPKGIIKIKNTPLIDSSTCVTVQCNIINSKKEVIPGATVSIFNRKESFTTGTSIDGTCSFNIDPGTYSVTVRSVGYNSISIDNVCVEEGKLLTLDVSMTVTVQILYEMPYRKRQ